MEFDAIRKFGLCWNQNEVYSSVCDIDHMHGRIIMTLFGVCFSSLPQSWDYLDMVQFRRVSPNPRGFLKFFVYSVLVVFDFSGSEVLWFGLFIAAAALPPRFFVGHSIYKGKAALSIEPRPPEFTPIDVCLTWILYSSQEYVLPLSHSTLWVIFFVF